MHYKNMRNVIILGSGRSGTSMVAGTFSKSGYYMGNNYLGQNNSNPKGFFEDYEVNTINEDILDLVLPSIPEFIRSIFFPTTTFYRARWLARIKPGTKMLTTSDINKRIEKITELEPFCYKDPRFSYTLPIWYPFLNKNKTVYVCVFREPYNTAASIVQECKESPALHRLKMTKNIALKVWLNMYQNILKLYHAQINKLQWIFVHYNQIINGEGLMRLQDITGVKIDNSFPDKSLNRTRIKDENLKHKKISNTYQRLCHHASYCP